MFPPFPAGGALIVLYTVCVEINRTKESTRLQPIIAKWWTGELQHRAPGVLMLYTSNNVVFYKLMTN